MCSCQHQVFTAAQLVVTKWKRVSATKNLFGNGYTMPKRGGGRTECEGGTHSGGLPTLRRRCLYGQRLQLVLWQCRTGTVVWRVGSGSCSSLGTARRTCVGVAGREELQVEGLGYQFNLRDCIACQWRRWSGDLSVFTTEEEKHSSDRYRCLWFSRWMEH